MTAALPDWPAAMPYSVARLAERWECSERLIYKLIERGEWLRPLSMSHFSAATEAC